MKCRVLLADGHWLIRAGLRATLCGAGDFEVAAEAADAAEALQRSAAAAPELVLLDAGLPGGGGLETARRLQAAGAARVLLMVERGDAALVREALAAGCAGLLRKDLCARELLEALRCVRAGGLYLDTGLARQPAQPQPPAAPAPDPLQRLSARERAVFLLIAEGATNRGAGERLGLSPKTVEKHRAAVMSKLRLRDALALRLLALELGLVARPEMPGEIPCVAPPRPQALVT